MKTSLAALALVASLAAAAAHAQKPQTDREANGLKGPVRAVWLRTSVAVKQGGRLVEVSTFSFTKDSYDAGGDLLSVEQFTPLGALISKAAYGYADGVRFGERFHPRAKVISLPTGNARPAPRPKLTPKPTPKPKPPPPSAPLKPDFVAKYSYKCDEKGRRVEVIAESKDMGRERTVYNFKDDGREVLEYSGEELLGRVVETFDAGGNLVAETDFNTMNGEVYSKSSYADYEFDDRGNWVKRVKSQWVNRGQSSFELIEVQRRIIEYF